MFSKVFGKIAELTDIWDKTAQNDAGVVFGILSKVFEAFGA